MNQTSEKVTTQKTIQFGLKLPIKIGNTSRSSQKSEGICRNKLQ